MPSAGAPPADWKQRRFGAEPPAELIKLAEDAGQRVLAACGIPPTMFATGGDAAEMREAFRRFTFSTIQPVAAIMQSEAATKLGVPVRFDFSALGAANVQGRARAFKSLVDGGMGVEQAARVTGL